MMNHIVSQLDLIPCDVREDHPILGMEFNSALTHIWSLIVKKLNDGDVCNLSLVFPIVHSQINYEPHCITA